MSQTMQQLIQNMLNSVLPTLNTPGGPYYLPTWITNNGYDPYGKTESMTWSVSLTDPQVIATAASICAETGLVGTPCTNPDAYFIAAPGNPPLLVLGGGPGDLLVSGFSNAVMASMTSQDSDAYQIVAIAQFSTLSNYPPNPVISGLFTFTEYCCCSLDQKTCDVAPVPEVGMGNFVVTIDGSCTATIVFEITGLAPGVLNIGMTSIKIVPPYDQYGNPAMTIAVEITSTPPGADTDTYNQAATEAFNSSQGRLNILQQINAVMNQPAELATMGQILTQVIDGYLKSTGQYPFNASSEAIY